MDRQAPNAILMANKGVRKVNGWPELPELWVALLQAWDEFGDDGAQAWGRRLMKLLAAEEVKGWEYVPPGSRAELFRGDHGVTLVARRWAPRENTDIHDHGGAAGAEMVLSGALTLYQYRLVNGHPVVRDSMTALAGSVELLDSNLIHAAQNLLPRPTVSLHLYGPPTRLRRTYPQIQ